MYMLSFQGGSVLPSSNTTLVVFIIQSLMHVFPYFAHNFYMLEDLGPAQKSQKCSTVL